MICSLFIRAFVVDSTIDALEHCQVFFYTGVHHTVSFVSDCFVHHHHKEILYV